MSATSIWNDWSCTARVTVDDASTLALAQHTLTELMGQVSMASSRFRSDSDISKVNHHAGRMVPVSSLTLTLVTAALESAKSSLGSVDPTVGAHLIRAGYDDDIAVVRDANRPDWSATDQTRPADWTKVRIDETLRMIGVPPGMRLDLGSSAKAWTVDEGASRIARLSGSAVLVEIGGDLAVSGQMDEPWRIAIGEVADTTEEYVELTHGAVATSSIVARRWQTPSGARHHIIDPATSEPAQGPWRTATVWAHTALEANTASTAAIVLGDRALEFLEDRGFAARIVAQNGSTVRVGAWPAGQRAA
ncbi:FAD:protein FMN transferase [soil metagenome]